MIVKIKKTTKRIVVTLAALSLAIPVTAMAIPPELTASWWQWALSIPDVPPEEGSAASIHPLVGDDNDFGAPNVYEFCGVGQHGPVWFLGGDFSGSEEPFTRTCQVPAGNDILLAVINGECSTAEGDANANNPVSVKAERLARCALKQIAPVDFYEATLNGQQLTVEKVSTSVPFSVFFPPSNVIGIDPAANPSLSQASGFWVLIPPQNPGIYELNFSGGISGVFEIEGTYNIEIVPATEQ